MVTHPANMIMTTVPKAFGSFASLERIQNYLLEPPRHDKRLEIRDAPLIPIDPLAIQFSGVTIQNSRTLLPILQDLNFTIKRGSIVVCSGTVGSGKSVLTRAILGEIAPSIGTISVSCKRIAYCSQTTWLPNTSIKDIIRGFPSRDEEDSVWYRKVLQVCCLNQDLNSLPDGDETWVGSRGMNLSGGQRQRIVSLQWI